MDISFIYTDPETGKVSFSLTPSAATGSTKLVQIVVLSLLNIPGKDALDPDLGAGLPELIGYSVGDDSSELLSEVVRRVKRAEQEVISAQAGKDIPDEERLRTIRIINVGQGNDIDEVDIKLRVINEAGRNTDFSL